MVAVPKCLSAAFLSIIIATMKGGKLKRFTASEIAFLRENASTMTVAQAAQHMDRHVGSVYIKLRELDITMLPVYFKWTPREFEFIRQNAKMPLVEQSRILGRSRSVIVKKRRDLGVAKSHFRLADVKNLTHAAIRHGARAEDVAKKFGWSVKSIYNFSYHAGYRIKYGCFVWPHPDRPEPAPKVFGLRTISNAGAPRGIRPPRPHQPALSKAVRRFSAAEIEALAHPRSVQVARQMGTPTEDVGDFRYIPLADGSRIRVLKDDGNRARPHNGRRPK